MAVLPGEGGTTFSSFCLPTSTDNFTGGALVSNTLLRVSLSISALSSLSLSSPSKSSLTFFVSLFPSSLLATIT
uniref:Uncharacterized protein n=1 Tax=Rhizophora mucronata TaxID=61149 RepID=A0A2P2JN69_RHIMU